MLLTVGELRARLETPLSDFILLSLADRAESRLVEVLGPTYAGASTAITETQAGYKKSLLLKRRVLTVETVTEYDGLLSSAVGQVRTEGTHFYLWPDEGRLERIGAGGKWSARVVVAYVPQDDRAAWREAVIDLVRLQLDRTAMRAEAVAGEYSYTAPENWEQESARIIRRLSFPEVF